MTSDARTGRPAARPAEDPVEGRSDFRTLSELRIFVALAAALGVLLESSLSLAHQRAALALVFVYAATSLLMLWAVKHRPGLVRASISYWLDAGWLILLLVAVGPESNLFVLLLFPIVLASVQSGLVQGLAMTLTCVVAYSVLSAWSPVSGNLFPAAFGPIIALGVLGYIAARWGDRFIRLKRRLTLLSEISAEDARLGESGVLLRLLDRLRAFARASRVVAMLPEPGDGHSTLYEVGAGDSKVDRVPNGVVSEFLDLPPSLIAGFNRHSPSRLLRPRFALYDIGEGRMIKRGDIHLGQLADLLATRHYQCFPLPVGQGAAPGRVCLCYDRRFRVPVAYTFLHQVAVQIALRIDNLRLIDRLTATAATGERRRISRDLHDSTVQPYVGLRMGLEALKRQAGAENPLSADIADLIGMADASIAQLRGYIVALRGQAEPGGGHVLPVLRTLVEQFQANSGIKTDLETQGDQALSPQQLDDFRHIVSEGLSNIRRHGRCDHATVRLDCTPDRMVLEFVNPAAAEVGPFHPRSLSERARDLGGRLEVIRSVEATQVRVTLPVWSRQPAGGTP